MTSSKAFNANSGDPLARAVACCTELLASWDSAWILVNSLAAASRSRVAVVARAFWSDHSFSRSESVFVARSRFSRALPKAL